MSYVSPVSREEPMKYVYPKLNDATAYNLSKQAVMSASDYIEATYRDVRIFMQLTQNCVLIRYIADG